MTHDFSSTAAFIWSVADLLRGDFKQSQYGRIILPFTLLRRLECVLEKKKDNVLAKAKTVQKLTDEAREKILLKEAGRNFYNTSPLSLATLSSNQILDDIESYINGFSNDAREIFEYFDFSKFLDDLNQADLLYLVVQKFASINLSPSKLSNHDMGLVFEELIRRFAESSNETAGEHFTPRDIIHLTTALVFNEDDDALTQAGKIRSIYDPTAGTGGFLSAGMEYVNELNPKARMAIFGQELNPESYAICKGDMLIKGQDIANIKLGNTLSDDQLAGSSFNYMLSNPPFGVDWKKIEKVIKTENTVKKFAGRFGAGLPRVSDGSLLFLLHLISKMQSTDKDGSRIGIILNGSPLFTGGAGSGESEIRRYILESDLLEAIIELPADMFYNTGIATYVWVLSNKKSKERAGKVQLISAKDMFAPMRKSLGSKRKFLTEDHIKSIVKLYGNFAETEQSKIFPTTAFGYRRITVERPLQLAIYPKNAERIDALQQDKAWAKLDDATQSAILKALKSFKDTQILSRDSFEDQLKATGLKLKAPQFKLLLKHLAEHDEQAEVCTDKKGNPEPNPDLRDFENVPLSQSVEDYFAKEVLPHVPDAWIDQSKKDEKDEQVGIVGYEIPLTRHFYKYTPPRSLGEINTDLATLEKDIISMLAEVVV